MTPAPTQRRADIDWIRIAAFGVLILYHVGLVYAPWDWHVRSPHTIEATMIGTRTSVRCQIVQPSVSGKIR